MRIDEILAKYLLKSNTIKSRGIYYEAVSILISRLTLSALYLYSLNDPSNNSSRNKQRSGKAAPNQQSVDAANGLAIVAIANLASARE